MKLNVKNKVVLLVPVLILLLSFGLSIANYWSAFEQTRKQLSENSLPLSTDNIYTDIQKVIIEPSLISSMMSNDTFVRDWLKHDEHDTQKIVKYLDSIKNKYGFSDTFLVSSATKKYYTCDGMLETLSPNKEDNGWYFRFSKQPTRYEINIDNNELIDNKLLLFFNYKIYDENDDLLGIVGVIFKASYISEMFTRFREYYQLRVFLMDKEGHIRLSEKGISGSDKFPEKEKLAGEVAEFLKDRSIVTEYQYDSKDYLVKSKYIDELGLYLVVAAELSQFTGSLQKQLLVNLGISLLITIVIILLILRTISVYTKQLNNYAHYDALTGLPNRRSFNENLRKIWLLHQRDRREKSLVFFDIDDFKSINDTYGHPVGDMVLIRIAELLRDQVRESDYMSRWGGEEFSLLLIDSSLEDSKNVAEKLRASIEKDSRLRDIEPKGITASFGLTAFDFEDSLNDILFRSDKALYEAKNAGKNCVEIYTSDMTK